MGQEREEGTFSFPRVLCMYNSLQVAALPPLLLLVVTALFECHPFCCPVDAAISSLSLYGPRYENNLPLALSSLSFLAD